MKPDRLWIVPLALITGSLTHAATIQVDRSDDAAAASACTAAAGDCSLRGAFAYANANPGTFINIPAGTYNLTVNELQIGSGTNTNTTIAGAGSSVTTIQQTLGNRRVININPTLSPNVTVNIMGVRIAGGNSPSDNFGGGGIIAGGPNNTLNLTGCAFENNTDALAVTPKGGAIEFAGGGVLNLEGCTFTNNSAQNAGSTAGVGGAIDYQLLNLPGLAGQGGLFVNNCVFQNNRAGSSGTSGAGGAIRVAVTTTQTPRTVSITRCNFITNQATNVPSGFGGAITSTGSTPIAVNYCRFNGNSASGGSTAIHQATGTSGTIDARWNWWTCNGGPSVAGCQTIGGAAANITTEPRLLLTLGASPTTICAGSASTPTASFLTDSMGGAVNTSNLTALVGRPINFNSFALGTAVSPQTALQASGTATATFQSNGTPGSGSASVTFDSGTASSSITINAPPTTATVGPNQNILSGGTTTGLGGNTPASGTGTWSIVGGGTGTFSPNTSTPNATFTHTGGIGPVLLRWTISTPSCGSSFADVTVTITPLTVVAWRSVRTHSGIGEIGIALSPTATGNGTSGPTVDPRATAGMGGVQKILVDLSAPVTLGNTSAFKSIGVLTDAIGNMGALSTYPPASVTLTSPTQLQIVYTPPLPDQGCYRFTLDTGLFAGATITGDNDALVRALWGDVTGDGSVVLGDALAAKAKIGQPVYAGNIGYDTNMTGDTINLGDALAVKARVTSPTRQAKCP